MTPELRIRILIIEALAFGLGFPVLFSVLAMNEAEAICRLQAAE